MFGSEELEFSKSYSGWKRGLSLDLTKEELLLKSKYEKLRKATELLRRYKTTGRCTSPIKVTAIHKPLDITKQSENFCKKTTEFKNWSKQGQASVKRSYPLNSFEDDARPRSVKVSGKNLTEDFLHKNLNKFGEIWKIRTNEEKTCSVLTFKRPSNAAKFVEVLNGTVVDGVKLDISLMQKNTSWSNVESPSTKQTEINSEGKSVHLRFKGHLTPRDCEEFFHRVGNISRIYLNQAKNFGFAMFENEKQAQRAIKEMDGEVYKGTRVYVSPQMFSKWDSPKAAPQSLEYYEDREIVSYGDLND